MCSGPLAYGGPSWSVNVPGVVPSAAGAERELCCHAYRSSVHRRRYSAFDAGDGRGGKVDLGRRSVDDHDARSSRVVGATIVASRAGWSSRDWAGIFWSSDMTRRLSDVLAIRVSTTIASSIVLLNLCFDFDNFGFANKT